MRIVSKLPRWPCLGRCCEENTPAQRERAPVKMPAWQQCTPLRRFCVSSGLEAGHPTSLQCTENSALLRSHFGSIPLMFQAVLGSIVLPEAQSSIDLSAAVQHCTASLLPTPSAEADAYIYSRIFPALPEKSDGLPKGRSYHVIRNEAGLFCRTSSSVRLWWEFREPKGPEKQVPVSAYVEGSKNLKDLEERRLRITLQPVLLRSSVQGRLM